MDRNPTYSLASCLAAAQRIGPRFGAALLSAALFAGCHTADHHDPHPAVALGLPRELDKTTLAEYVIEPPDILMIEASDALPGRPVAGERLVRPDGTILLPSYGEVYVVGMTPRQAESAIADLMAKHLTTRPQVSVDVASYNSKFYYVWGEVDRPGRYPVTGNDTVLDAMSLAGGPTPFANTHTICLVRPNDPAAQFAPEVTEGGGQVVAVHTEFDEAHQQILPVDLRAVVEDGDPTTNYQLLPGDRVVVKLVPAANLERKLDPILTIAERVLSIGVLGRLIGDPGGFN
jgi:polysaccharide export outer membrane protein